MKDELYKAKFYKKIKGDIVGCELCNHFCVIREDMTGNCGVRKNIKGELYSLVYGRPASLSVDPIEKKPFYHFMPGTSTFSFGTFGCNFHCKNCHNYEISQKDISYITPEIISPKQIVDAALKEKCPSISYTYNEPTVFAEYALDIMKEAKEKGLKNVWVSNGFIYKETLKEIIPYLDAINVDLKSMDDFFYQSVSSARVAPVLENLKFLHEAGVHLEITTLVIPTLSDDLDMLKRLAIFIANELGKDVPWHISRFSPEISWKLKDLEETDTAVLEKVYKIGKKAHLKYVYAQGISENTVCPVCDQVNIERKYYHTERVDQGGKCSKCGFSLNIID